MSKPEILLMVSGSIAAFKAGELQLYQVLFARSLNNKLPWSRAHLYGNPAETRFQSDLTPEESSDA